jgi:tetratricopeptide (TPR) repeat protein
MERALRLALEAEDSLMVGFVLARQAERAVRLGAADAAIGLAQAAQRQRDLTVHVRALAALYEALGRALAADAYACEQRLDEAYQLAESSEDIDVAWDGLGRHYANLATVLASEARCRLWLGQAEKALDAANAALAARLVSRRRGGGLQYAGLAIACAAAGQTERAADEGLEALAVARKRNRSEPCTSCADSVGCPTTSLRGSSSECPSTRGASGSSERSEGHRPPPARRPAATIVSWKPLRPSGPSLAEPTRTR